MNTGQHFKDIFQYYDLTVILMSMRRLETTLATGWDTLCTPHILPALCFALVMGELHKCNPVTPRISSSTVSAIFLTFCNSHTTLMHTRFRSERITSRERNFH